MLPNFQKSWDPAFHILHELRSIVYQTFGVKKIVSGDFFTMDVSFQKFTEIYSCLAFSK